MKLTQKKYNHLIDSKKKGHYACIICDVVSELYEEKIFKVEDSDTEVKMKCIIVGGMWEGTHCYTLATE
jgi:hypothetical protein